MTPFTAGLRSVEEKLLRKFKIEILKSVKTTSWNDKCDVLADKKISEFVRKLIV